MDFVQGVVDRSEVKFDQIAYGQVCEDGLSYAKTMVLGGNPESHRMLGIRIGRAGGDNLGAIGRGIDEIGEKVPDQSLLQSQIAREYDGR